MCSLRSVVLAAKTMLWAGPQWAHALDRGVGAFAHIRAGFSHGEGHVWAHVQVWAALGYYTASADTLSSHQMMVFLSIGALLVLFHYMIKG